MAERQDTEELRLEEAEYPREKLDEQAESERED